MTIVGEKVYKQFETKATSIDEANFTITFKVSDSRVDRDGEVVSQKDWQMDNYTANPTMLWGHDPSKPEYVIGQCIKMEYSPTEDCHYGTYKLDAGFNDTAKLVWNQLVSGTLRTVSLGFINHDYEIKDGIPHLTGIEPLETSVVAIPANAGALAKSLKAGKISEKDARYLMKTMREEAERIEKQLTVDKPNNKENQMDEATQKQLLESVAKLTTGQEAINKRLDQVSDLAKHKGAVADILNADRGWEVEDEKWYNVQEVAKVYSAFCEAYFYTATPVGDFKTLLNEFIELAQQVADGAEADGDGAVAKALKTVDVEKAKAALTAMSTKSTAPADAEDNEEDANKVDPAKGGDNDQPGAGTSDSIDDDTEVTPEIQAQLDAELDAEDSPK
jgi:hypothetical protein